MSTTHSSTSSSPPPPPCSFGASLSSYHIPHPTHPLGHGSFSTVHYALALPSEYPVALKLIPRTFLSRPKLKRRILTEIRLHLTLCHDCIVRLYRVFVSEKYVVLVLELCKGGSLAHLIKKKKRQVGSSSPLPSPILPLSAVRQILVQLVDGLEYLHSHGVIHRDLKLGNIFLTSRPTRQHHSRSRHPRPPVYSIKIGDFGLSHRLLSATERRRTQLGTPNYIAPEILQSIPHGKQVDLWSLGCIIYALVKGVPPFHSSSVKGTLRRVKKFGVGGGDVGCSSDVCFDGLGSETGLGEIVRGLLCGDQERRWGLDDVKSHWWMRGECRPIRTGRTQSQSESRREPRERENGTGSVAGGGREMYWIQKTRPTSTSTSTSRLRPTPRLRPRPRPLPEQDAEQPERQMKPKRSVDVDSDDDASYPYANFQLLSTDRIEPYMHRTKHGSVEILTDGRVVVRHRSTRFVIARSGTRMAILSTTTTTTTTTRRSRTRARGASPIVLVVPPPRGDRVQRDLFMKYRAFYEFGRLFVEVLRSKTPKVEFVRHSSTSIAESTGITQKENGTIRCALMENSPRADFEVVWCSSGLGLAYSRKEERVSIRRARRQKMNEPGPVGMAANSLRWSGEPCATVLVRDRVVVFPKTGNGEGRRKSLASMPELHPFLRTMMRLLKVCESAERRAEREGRKFPLMIRDVSDVRHSSRLCAATAAARRREEAETTETAERERVSSSSSSGKSSSFPFERSENFKRAAAVAVASSSSCSTESSSSEYSPRLSVSSTLSSARSSTSRSPSSSPISPSLSKPEPEPERACEYRCCAKRYAVEEFSRVSLAGLDQDDDDDDEGGRREDDRCSDVRPPHEMRTTRAVKEKHTAAAGWDMLFW